MASEFATVLADMPGAASKLVHEHAPTPDGRCGICRAGPQAGYVRHPCAIWTVARAALDEIARRRVEG